MTHLRKKPLNVRLSFVMLLILILLSACGSSETTSFDIEEATSSDIEIEADQVSDQYIEDSDHQYNWGQAARNSGIVTAGNGGYYVYNEYSSGNALLLYGDSDTATYMPLCARANCSHDSTDCSAWFGEYCVDRIVYASGSLYMTGSSAEDDTEVNLYRISSDGQQRELVRTLFRAEGDVISYISLIHRGYLYYYIAHQDKTEIFRVLLDGTGDTETVYAEDSRLGSEVSMMAYGNYLYIQDVWYTDETYETMDAYIGRYCIQTGEFEILKEDIIYDFAVSETTLYYQDWDRTMAFDLATGDETLLYESEIPVSLFYDGDVLCLDNGTGIFLLEQAGSDVAESRTITVLSTTGEVISKFSLDHDAAEFLGGDGKYYFCIHPSRPDNTPVSLCTKDSMLSGEPEWVDVDVS